MNETIEHCEVDAFKVPTDLPESDGTAVWNSTTLILVRLRAGKARGLGYTYSHECCVPLIREKLLSHLRGKNPMDHPSFREQLKATVRNFGRMGIASTAIAAVDVALWDLKARLLGVPLARLLGMAQERIPVYGSGGFTSYTDKQLQAQLENWVDEGISMVKMKVGRDPGSDAQRVKQARKAIGRESGLFVDANGAYSRKLAQSLAEKFAEQNATWFEEPVSSENLTGLHFLRERVPGGMEISAGEYNYDSIQARRMLEAQAVDVLQADATRCGITGFLEAAALCESFDVPLSSHTAPALHAHLCCAAPRARHAEYFHDHVRIEQMFFSGATTAHKSGFLQPDLSQPGLGLEFKERDAAKFQIKL
ncbi:MAG TPA: enolase C-terminal domain-like protein [Verrucomicrobiae bacterium]|nr:enolase C-terminal domain-like protein [Verrucomicrobiae bacterium]